MAAVHAQSRPTLLLAVVFAVAAGVATVLPNRTGMWLPLHLFVVGGVLLAISAATQLLAVTWGAAPAPPGRTVGVQRALLAAGAGGLAVARELAVPTAFLAAAGLAVIASLILLGLLLLRIRQTSVQARFAPVIDHYVAALALGVAGSVAGVLLVTGAGPVAADRLRAAHLTLNLLGLVGIVVAGTVPWFVATTAKVRVSRRATPVHQRVQLGALVLSTVTATAGELTGSQAVTSIGLASYALCVAGVARLLPRLGAKQLRWAGPRLVQLLAGLAWLAGSVAVAAASGTLADRAALVVAIGGYGQIVAGALAYLGPVLRGGGHERLADGFRVTRSWLGLVAGSVAAVAAALALSGVLAAAVVVWVADIGVRGLLLAQGNGSSASTARISTR